MTITVYSTPSCVQCRATERHTTSRGIKVEHIDLAEHPDILAALKERGLTQAPVVIVTDKDGEVDHWTGYNPDKLDEYGAKQKLELALAAV